MKENFNLKSLLDLNSNRLQETINEQSLNTLDNESELDVSPKIASVNVNSLLLHIDEIRTLVKDLGIHILAINETKLDENINDDLVSIEGYTFRDVIATGMVVG